MSDDEARERARRRLEERTARLHPEKHPHSGQRAADHRPAQARPHEPYGGGHLGVGGVVQRIGSAALSALAGAARVLGALVAKLGPKGVAALFGVIALVIVIVFAVGAIRGCTSAEIPSDAGEQPEPVEQFTIDQAALATLVGDEAAATLVEAAATSEDAGWIASHLDSYAMDGDAVQAKLPKLAAAEPEARAFVRGFPDVYPADAPSAASDQPTAGEVPRLYQWDVRWGSTVYSSTAFALTGCCPTSYAMVYQGLTGKSDLSPYDMGRRATEGGFETAYDGTDAAFLVNDAANLGLTCETLGVDAASLRAALEGGAVVICNVGPGDFTENGHFFVITGLADDGTLKVNDPYSAERSNRTWDVDQVIGQTKALWAYRVA